MPVMSDSRVRSIKLLRFGKHCVRSAATLPLQREKPHARTELPWRKLAALDGETARQRLYLPRLNIIV